MGRNRLVGNIIFSLFLTLFALGVNAQETDFDSSKASVYGQVVDQITKEGVPFASVVSNCTDGSLTEVSCDSMGNFELKLDTGIMCQIKAKSDIMESYCKIAPRLKYFSSDKKIVDTKVDTDKAINFILYEIPICILRAPHLLLGNDNSSNLIEEDLIRINGLREILYGNPSVKFNIELRSWQRNFPIDSLKAKAIKVGDYFVSLGYENLFSISDTLSFHTLECYDLPRNLPENSMLKNGVVLNEVILKQLSKEELELVKDYTDGIFFRLYLNEK